jgi:hypothetical protein
MERTGGCMCCVCCVADTAPLANAAASVQQAGGSHAAGRAWRRVLQGMQRDDGPGGVAGGGGVSIVVQHVRTLQGVRLLLPRNRDVRGQEGQCVLATVLQHTRTSYVAGRA